METQNDIAKCIVKLETLKMKIEKSLDCLRALEKAIEPEMIVEAPVQPSLGLGLQNPPTET